MSYPATDAVLHEMHNIPFPNYINVNLYLEVVDTDSKYIDPKLGKDHRRTCLGDLARSSPEPVILSRVDHADFLNRVCPNASYRSCISRRHCGFYAFLKENGDVKVYLQNESTNLLYLNRVPLQQKQRIELPRGNLERNDNILSITAVQHHSTVVEFLSFRASWQILVNEALRRSELAKQNLTKSEKNTYDNYQKKETSNRYEISKKSEILRKEYESKNTIDETHIEDDRRKIVFECSYVDIPTAEDKQRGSQEFLVQLAPELKSFSLRIPSLTVTQLEPTRWKIGRRSHYTVFANLLKNSPDCLLTVSRDHFDLKVCDDKIELTVMSSNPMWIGSPRQLENDRMVLKPQPCGTTTIIEAGSVVAFARTENNVWSMFLQFQVTVTENDDSSDDETIVPTFENEDIPVRGYELAKPEFRRLDEQLEHVDQFDAEDEVRIDLSNLVKKAPWRGDDLNLESKKELKKSFDFNFEKQKDSKIMSDLIHSGIDVNLDPYGDVEENFRRRLGEFFGSSSDYLTTDTEPRLLEYVENFDTTNAQCEAIRRFETRVTEKPRKSQKGVLARIREKHADW